MTGNPVVHLQRVDHVVVLSIDNPPVNALSVAVRQAFLSHLTLMAETTGVTALVLACAGKSFSAGADLAELGDAPADPSMGAVMRAIESAGYLIVAAIQGSALGGGLELALLADYRIATPDAQFGLPEINLGLLPGGGATQRLPRLIGVQPAIELMRSGKPIGSAKALELGLIDEVAAGDLLQAAIALACTQADKPQRRRPGLQPPAEARDIDFPAQRRQAVQSFPSVEAAAYAVDAVEASTRLPLAEGLAVEAALFRQARGSAGSLALRHLFAAERLVGKIPGLERTLPRQVARVAVIGAGTMGIGVSIAVLDAGYELQLIEATAAALERGVAQASIFRRPRAAISRSSASLKIWRRRRPCLRSWAHSCRPTPFWPPTPRRWTLTPLRKRAAVQPMSLACISFLPPTSCAWSRWCVLRIPRRMRWRPRWQSLGGLVSFAVFATAS
jgi:3-hydroxyacyl-CoA dehydrogenase